MNKITHEIRCYVILLSLAYRISVKRLEKVNL